ncbi:MAG: NUMOD3 domain-containing DNA-binding protein [Gemmatimonadota bacterium]|nr:NUMOD3 domain-containing DNA-binding protein [Gemmatimonadota bacterium]
MDGYVEHHHVIPRCLGGDDTPGNLVRLTAEEHFVAHQLLVKMHRRHAGLTWALVNMSGGNRRQAPRMTNRLYGWMRKRHAEAMRQLHTGRAPSDATRAKMRDVKLGKKRKPHSEETKVKMAAASRGRPKSEAHRFAIAAAQLGKTRAPHSDATKAKMSASQQAANSNRDHSHKNDPKYRARQSANMRRIWAERQAQKQG